MYEYETVVIGHGEFAQECTFAFRKIYKFIKYLDAEFAKIHKIKKTYL